MTPNKKKNIIKRGESLLREGKHQAVSRVRRDQGERGGKGDDEGMRRGHILSDRQIKGGESSHDEDSWRGKKGHRRTGKGRREEKETGGSNGWMMTDYGR